MTYKHVVLASGGLDSSVLLHFVKANFSGKILALSFLYGQKHAGEIRFAEWQAGKVNGDHRVIQIPPDWFAMSASALLSDTPTHALRTEMPDKSYEELREEMGPSPTYVPFRNGIFLSIAAAIALQHDADRVWIASHKDDAHNWAYPDCTPEFNEQMSDAIYKGTYNKVLMLAPFEEETKADIVARGDHLGVNFIMTNTCYQPSLRDDGVPGLPCGTCPACVSRAAAFEKAGVIDLLVV